MRPMRRTCWLLIVILSLTLASFVLSAGKIIFR